MRLYSSKAFLAMGLALLLGILLASLFPIPQEAIFGLGFIGTALLLIFWFGKRHEERKAIPALLGALLLLGSIGLWRAESVFEKTPGLVRYNDHGNVTIVGTVIRDPSERLKNTKLTIAADTLSIASGQTIPVSGSLLAFVPRFSAYQYGDRLRLEGELRTPERFAEFDYPAYLAKDHIYSVMYQARIAELPEKGGNPILRPLFSFRQRTEASIAALLPAPQSALLRAILLGDEGEMTQDLKAALNKTGLRHIVAISGMNITLIAVMLMGFFLRLGFWRHHAFWFAIAGVTLFVIFVGAPASAVRAGIMGGLYLLAQKEGRLYSGASAVVLAGAFMALLHPQVLRWDIGFQLSFLAVLGLFAFSEYFEQRLKFLPEIFQIRSIAAMTLAASLPTMPILAASFHQVPLIGLVTNLLVLPWLASTMVLGIFAASIGTFLPVLGQIFAVPLLVPTSMLLWTAETFRSFPTVAFSFPGGVGWILSILYFSSLFWFAQWAVRRVQKPIDLVRELP